MRLGSKRVSATTVRLTTLFKAPTLALAATRHIVSVVYYATTCATYRLATPKDLRTFQAFWPAYVGPIMGALALLHTYELGRTFHRAVWCKSRLQSVVLASPLNDYLSQVAQLCVFHWMDVVCQTYQAYRMSYYLVDRRYAITFAVLVSAYSLVTPWFLFAKHAVARRSLILIVNNCLGFMLNSVFPIALFFMQALKLVVLDRNIQYDDKFVTVSLLIGRYLMVSSPADLVTKIVLQFLSCVSIRRLVQSVTRYEPRQESAVGPTALTLGVSSPMAHLVAPDKAFQLQFQHRRWLLWYLVLNLVWGSTVVACAVAATFFRAPCPDYCVFSTSPWFDLTCSCVYVEVNCALRGIPGTTIDEFIQPSEIGTSLFTLTVRRCDLRHGVAIAALQPFQALFGVFLYMTNMTTWPSDPTGLSWPSSLALLHVRGSQLQHIPDAFAALPDHIVFFRLEGGNISVIPEEVFQAWANLSSLALSNLQLTRLPPSLSMFHGLMSLELRGNLLSAVPFPASDVAAMPLLQSVDLSANYIHDIPVDPAWATVRLELSSNPISALPDAFDRARLVTRQVVLDDTPFCAAARAAFCLPKCARQCESILLGDYRCDAVCYSRACNWDNGDCAAFGLSFDSS